MTRMLTHDLLSLVLDNDEALFQSLLEHGIMPQLTEYDESHCEDARVAYVLTRELEVNLEGVDIILRMRRELIQTRQQVAALVTTLQTGRKP